MYIIHIYYTWGKLSIVPSANSHISNEPEWSFDQQKKLGMSLRLWKTSPANTDSTAWFILVQPTCGFNEQQIIGWQGW